MTQLAIIGHNNPPSEIEILKRRLAEYNEPVETYERLSKKELPAEIVDDVQAASISDHIAAIGIAVDQVEKIHKKEKQPFWDAGRAADTWKNDYGIKFDALKKKAEPILLAWNKKKKAAEDARLAEIAKQAREAAEKLAAEAIAHEAEGITDTANDLMEAAIQQDEKASLIETGGYQTKTVSRGTFSSSSLKTEWVGKIESMATIDLEALRNYLKEDDVQSALNRAVKDGKRDIRGAIIEQEDKLNTRRR